MKALRLLAILATTVVAALPALAAPPDDKAPPEPKPPVEPAVQRQVLEDDNVRIEELRVRGQTQSIVVRSKIRGVAPYRIVPGSGALDPSQPGQATGQRLWQFPF